jgi:D-glycero-alpha-D-manno-heptose 1-phosphate guanylyltransferase
MVPVAGRPFLEFVLDRLVEGGFTRITLSLGYLAQVVQDHFGLTYRGADLRYSVERQALGTGGAIRHALQDRGDEPALVVNGDTLLQADFSAIARWYEQAPVPVAMVLRRMGDVGRYGAVMIEGERVTGFLEKGRAGPGLINAGVYIVTPALFPSLDLPRVFSFETDVLQRHCAVLRPRAFISDAWFIDIGVPDDLERARVELATPA